MRAETDYAAVESMETGMGLEDEICLAGEPEAGVMEGGGTWPRGLRRWRDLQAEPRSSPGLAGRPEFEPVPDPPQRLQPRPIRRS